MTTPTPVTVIGTLPSQTGPPGDPARGKALYAANGCGACHTFTPAGTTGKVGPNLDHLAGQAPRRRTRARSPQFTNAVDRRPGRLHRARLPERDAADLRAEALDQQQLADLVAFLTKGS